MSQVFVMIEWINTHSIYSATQQKNTKISPFISITSLIFSYPFYQLFKSLSTLPYIPVVA